MDRQVLLAGARLTWILLPIWSGFLISGMNGLKNSDVTLVVPEVILQGETLVMDCRFPANESAYINSVKWYKGSREFFQYTPKQHPRIRVKQFGDVNIQVDENQSGMNKIVVKEVPAKFRGNISCEVTTEPNFSSVYLTSPLMVAVPPDRDPVLTVDVIKKNPYENASIGLSTWQQGLRTKYDQPDGYIVNVGDTLVAKCTSGPSTPPVKLSFQINDHPPTLYRSASIQEELKLDAENRSATVIATMNLTLLHDAVNLGNRKISIRCLAKMYNLYNASSREVIKELPRENSVTASSYGHNANHCPRLKSVIPFGYMVLLFQSSFGVVV